MTQLRQRLIEDLQLKGMSERTQEMYVRAVRQLAEHYHKPPDQISDEELRQYFLYVKNVKHWSRSGTTIALCGLKFFYEHTLQRSLTTLQLVRPPREKKLPVVLSREEVRQILSEVRLLRYRACLTTLYSCGLRLQEGSPPSHRPGQCSQAHSRPSWQGWQGSLRPLARLDSGTASPVLENPRQPPLGLSSFRTRRHSSSYRPKAYAHWQRPGRLWRRCSRQRDSEEGLRPHAPPFLRHSLAGGRRQPPSHPGVSRSQLGRDHRALYAPDLESPRDGHPGH
jgi:Phage integrase, N-terminal SAM-like domain